MIPRDDLHKRGLSSPVVADQPDAFARHHREGNAVDGLDGPEMLGDLNQFEYGCRLCHLSASQDTPSLRWGRNANSCVSCIF